MNVHLNAPPALSPVLGCPSLPWKPAAPPEGAGLSSAQPGQQIEMKIQPSASQDPD